jgi:hypothetical protein
MQKQQENDSFHNGGHFDSSTTQSLSTPECSSESRLSQCEEVTAPTHITTKLVLLLGKNPLAPASQQAALGEDATPKSLNRRTDNTLEGTHTSYTTKIGAVASAQSADLLEMCDGTQSVVR